MTEIIKSDNKSELELLKETFLLCLKNWYVFAATMVICLIIAVLYHKNVTPVYKIQSRVVLRHNESLIGAGSIGKGGSSLLSAVGLSSGKENIEDETKKLSSHGYLRNVIKELELYKRYNDAGLLSLFSDELYDSTPVVVTADDSVTDTLEFKITFNLKIKKEETIVEMVYQKKKLGDYKIASFPSTLKTPLGDFTFSQTDHFDKANSPKKLKIEYGGLDYMAQIYAKKLDIDFDKKSSDFISLEFPSKNIELAKQLLNKLIDNYNAEWDIEKKNVNDKTLAFIDERLKLTEHSLKAADYEIKTFKDKYQLTDLEADVKYYFTVSGELQPAIIEAKSQLGMVDIAIEFIQKNKYEPIPLSLSPENEKIAEIAAKYNEFLRKRNDIAKADSKLEIIKTYDIQLDAERTALLQTLYNTKDGLKFTIAELKKKENEVNNKIGRIPEIERDFLSMKREQTIQETILVFLLEMREESGVKGISLLPKLQVVSKPYVLNKKVSPDKFKTLLVTLFFGGILLPGLIILLKRKKY